MCSCVCVCARACGTFISTHTRTHTHTHTHTHTRKPGILALNSDVVQSADTINVGQKLRIPSEKDARRLALLGTESPACNYAINPSFEEAADSYGLALACILLLT